MKEWSGFGEEKKYQNKAKQFSSLRYNNPNCHISTQECDNYLPRRGLTPSNGQQNVTFFLMMLLSFSKLERSLSFYYIDFDSIQICTHIILICETNLKLSLINLHLSTLLLSFSEVLVNEFEM